VILFARVAPNPLAHDLSRFTAIRFTTHWLSQMCMQWPSSTHSPRALMPPGTMALGHYKDKKHEGGGQLSAASSSFI
jgi:hypothetical protein